MTEKLQEINKQYGEYVRWGLAAAAAALIWFGQQQESEKTQLLNMSRGGAKLEAIDGRLAIAEREVAVLKGSVDDIKVGISDIKISLREMNQYARNNR